MKYIVLFLSFLIVSSGYALAKAPSANGRFTTAYIKPKNSDFADLHQSFVEEKVFNDLAELLNGVIKLPKSIAITSNECGEVNAFFDPSNNTITMCYEFLVDLAAQAESMGLSEDEAGDFIAGTMIFVLLHELGHGLTHVLDLPITGREEDAVDQLATVLLLESAESAEEFMQNAGMIASASQWFANISEGEYETESFAGEHSMGEQRFYNMWCWVYGSDPAAFSNVVEDGLLPEARSERCPGEYERMSKSWNRMLEPYMKE